MPMTNNKLNSTMLQLIAYLESSFDILATKFRASPKIKQRYKYIEMQARVSLIKSRVNNGLRLPINDIPSIVQELTCLIGLVETNSHIQNTQIQALFSPLHDLAKTIRSHQTKVQQPANNQHQSESYKNGQKAALDKIACLYQHTNDEIVEKIGKRHYTKDKFMSYIVSEGGSFEEYLQGASDIFDEMIGPRFEPSNKTLSPSRTL